FPESYFRDWDPASTRGTTVTSESADGVVAPEQDALEVQGIVTMLEEFVRRELLGDGRSEPIAPDAMLLDEGLVGAAGLFPLLAFIAERFGVRFGDDELLAENFRTLEVIARAVAQRRAPR